MKADEPTGRVLFEENQAFPKWVVLVILASNVLIVTGIAIAARMTEIKGRTEMLMAMIFAISLGCVIVYLFYHTRFEKIVTTNGFYYRWTPLQKSYRYLQVSEIDHLKTRKAPSLKYGYSWVPGYGKVHNLNRGEGLELHLSSGKKMFFGTNQPLLFQKSVEEIISSKQNKSWRV